MEYKDYYKTLGIGKNASEKDIKTAYRKLARKFHPDVNPGNKEAEARFKEINEANAVLTDPEKRKKYDTLGPEWEKRYQQGYPGAAGYNTGGAGTTADFSDFFETLFGQRGSTGTDAGGFDFDIGSIFGRQRGRTRTVEQRGSDAEQGIEVTLAEAYDGAERAFTLQSTQTCPTCQGTGLQNESLCPTCQGAGAIPKTKRLDVKIPKGVKEGSRIRISGEGNPGVGGGSSGDLYLVVHMVPDPRFRREGDDLYTEVSVPMIKLILGGEAEVPTVKGRLTVRVPAASQNGRTLRLGGQGVPTLRGGKQGDLYVKLNALLPTTLSEKQRDLFQQLEQAGV